MLGFKCREINTRVLPRYMSSSPAYKVTHETAPLPRKRIVLALTGATGSIYGIEVLRMLKLLDVETHVVVSKWAEATMRYECGLNVEDIKDLSSHLYSSRDLSARISSGSFRIDGMVIAPCSMKTLAACRMGFEESLITRAAGVCLKERRKLVLAVRETPLSSIHLENMLSLSQNGAVIFPPVPAFYCHPETLQDVVRQSALRILDQLGIEANDASRWNGGLSRTQKKVES